MGIQDRDYYWEHRNRVDPNMVDDGESGRVNPPGNVHKAWRRQDSNSVERLLKILALIAIVVGAILIAQRWYIAHSFNRALANSAQFGQKVSAEQAQALARANALALERARKAETERQLQMQKIGAENELRRKLIAEQALRTKAKQDAWERFYKPSKNCFTEASVECGNEHIIARRAFNEQYKD